MKKHKLIFEPKAHKYSLDGVKIPHVWEILEGAGVAFRPPGIADDLWLRNQRFGKAGHIACQLHDLGRLNEKRLDKGLKPYLESWKMFRGIYRIKKFKIIEMPVYSVRWQFAGTLDRAHPITVLITPRLTLLDLKFSDTLPKYLALQLAGYKIAYEEMTGKKIQARWVVQLQPGTRPKILPCEDKSDEDVFIACLQLYNWRKKNGLLPKRRK